MEDDAGVDRLTKVRTAVADAAPSLDTGVPSGASLNLKYYSDVIALILSSCELKYI